MLQSQTKSKRAFNLLEVVIAGFIFSTVSVAFLGVWGMQARALEKSRHHLLATKIAEQLIEDSMEKGFERMAATRGRNQPESADNPETAEHILTMELRSPSGEWGTVETTYHTSVSVDPVGDVDDDRLKKVVVSVDWDDSSKVGQVKLVTFLSGVF